MKIFGIGLSKTGTTSLASALEILGYRTRDYPGLTSYVPGDLSSIDPQILAQNEALTDTPIPSFYRELDARYPGSKFILTVREMDGWLLSCKKQFNAELAEKQNEAHNQLFMDLYGTTVFDEALFRRGYQRFVEGVHRSLQGPAAGPAGPRRGGGDGWEELCAFLGKPVPEIPFPKANVTRIQWMDLQELVSIAKEAGQELLNAHRSVVPTSADDGASSLIPTFVRKAVHSLRGGRAGAIEAAVASAQKVLTRRLGKLNAEIPVISRLAHAVPLSDRGRWNHFWIVDPLDGEAGFGTAARRVHRQHRADRGPEADRRHRPRAAVGHDLLRDGRQGRLQDGRRRRARCGWPRPPNPRQRLPARSIPPRPARRWPCAGAWKQAPSATKRSPDSMEWHSAAPHAVARLMGRRIVVADRRRN